MNDDMAEAEIAKRMPRQIVEFLAEFFAPWGGRVTIHPEDPNVVLTIRAPVAAFDALLADIRAEKARRQRDKEGG